MRFRALKHRVFLVVYTLSALIFLSCTKGNGAPPDPAPETEKVAQASTVMTHGGNKRIGISWKLTQDHNVHSYQVIWSSSGGRGSLTEALPSPDKDGVYQVVISDIDEGKYLFEVFMLDKQGNASAKTSVAGTVYGPQYQASLSNPEFERGAPISQGVQVSWSVKPEGLIGREVRVSSGESAYQIQFLPAGDAKHTIPGVEAGEPFEYRAAYVPDDTALDTFYTDYTQARLGAKYACHLHYDADSKTSYFLTRIYHSDASGNPVRLRLAHTVKESGETVREFALRTNSTLAFNASTQVKLADNPNRNNIPSVVAIVDGTIINNAPRDNRYTLGIPDNNKLMVFQPGTTAETILASGVKNAVTAFIPLIQDHQAVSDRTLNFVGNSSVKHPRQVIAQLDNGDILFLTTGGRSYGGEGMTAKELIAILKKLKVRFAYNLDGGGSTSAVIEGEFVNWKIDKSGTQERKRPTFLYVE